MDQEYRHLCLDERIEIEKGLERGESGRSIAKRLNRNPSTICREIRRNAWRPSNTSAAYRPVKLYWCRRGHLTQMEYRASVAHHRAASRAQNSHQMIVFTSDEMVDYVVTRLRDGWTPAMIAGRRQAGFSDCAPHRVSHETIYRWIYSKDQQHRRLFEYLVRGRKTRRHKHGRRVHSSGIRYRISISQRPCEIDDRSQFGHWEGDTVVGRAHKNGIHTEVERTTRFLAARTLTSLTSHDTVDAQKDIFHRLPPEAARSVTLDNGSENHRAHELDEYAMPVYYCHPYCSWERGTNENTNGVLRRYLPKGTDFTDLTQHDLDEIVTAINNRPLKCLGWYTPAEAFNHQLELLANVTVALPN
ncbi:MAG: IS30 family transposase [Propionibacteriaceae bacterium]|nr:IS30 family transposase [Propionibacteriaceae bacterium]